MVMGVDELRDQGERLGEMLQSEAAGVRDQAWELLGCLDSRVRWEVARALLKPQGTPWRLAARCLLPEEIAEGRLRLFAARCAQYKLERERRCGREPEEWAWRAVEAVERRLRGTIRSHEYERIVRETEVHRDPYRWEWGWAADVLDECSVQMDEIPESWSVWDAEGERSLMMTQHLVDETEAMRNFSHLVAAVDRSEAAAMAAAFCLIEPFENEWGELEETIPGAETVREWRWQRRAWVEIVVRGRDGLALLYAGR